PVQDQGQQGGAVVIVAYRPGIVRSGGDSTEEEADPRGGAGLLDPRLSVPGQDQRLVRGALAVPAHRPYLPGGSAGRNTVQNRVSRRSARVGAGYLGPLMAVPVQGQAALCGAVE